MIKKITKTAMLLSVMAILGVATVSYAQLSNNSNSKSTLSQFNNEATTIAFAEVNGDFFSEAKCGEGKCGEGKCGEGKTTEKKSEKKEAKKETKKETKSEKSTKKETKKETKPAKESKCGAGKCGGN